ncbi:hypothetical protein ACFSSA_04960 [Luteolibacter algae]|uniref:Anti sigma-E protein RseA N-terminal domain-containing protein n=1 Tax=Luteolibacter algae TaxID=454151 RepID=A0ABW5D4Q6_9BACT
MKPSVEQISELLSQRSDLRPEEGYWQDFLQEFHHNQRAAETSRSAPAAFFERIRSWVSEVSPSKWAYGAGLAYAAATVAFFLVPRGAEVETMPSSPVNHQVVPAPALEQLEQLDLDPSTEGTAGEQVF